MSSAPLPLSAKPVICLGCTIWDTILKVDQFPAGGGKLLASQAVQAAGGMITVAAVSLARLGQRVKLWSRIGSDATAHMLLEDLAREQVDTSGVRQTAGGRTTLSSILVDRDGERLVVPYFDPSLDPDPGWLPLSELAEASAVLCDMRWQEGARVVFSEARRLGIPTILDADVAPAKDLRAMIALADHVLFSEPALRCLIDAPADQALRQIAGEIDARVVGVTLGARGALVWEKQGADARLHQVATIKIQALDTLNAGDVWHGAYVYGLVQGWPLSRTVRAANVAAAIKCEHFGGRLGAPGLPEVLARMSQHQDELVCTVSQPLP